jgi:hypothetical protein
MNPQTRSAFAYLSGFRRSIPPLGSVLAWLTGWPGLAAGLCCIAVGELLETTYYINVLRWAGREQDQRREGSTDARLPGDRAPDPASFHRA